MLSVHICHQASVIFQWKHCTFRITGSCNTSLQCTMKSKCPLRDSSVCRFKHVLWEKRLIAREPYVRCNDRSPRLPLKKNGSPYDVRGINQHVMCEFITCGFWREMTIFHGSGINSSWPSATYMRRDFQCLFPQRPRYVALISVLISPVPHTWGVTNGSLHASPPNSRRSPASLISPAPHICGASRTPILTRVVLKILNVVTNILVVLPDYRLP